MQPFACLGSHSRHAAMFGYDTHMIVECPGCQSRYDVSGREPGTKARCRCGTVFPLPEFPSTAGAMGCPKCGASVSRHDQRCGYCSTALALVACPRCFGMIFSGTQHCNYCGAKAGEPAQPLEKLTGRRCPRCSDRPTLLAQLVADALLDQCAGCGGIFVDNSTFDRAVKNKDQQAQLATALDTSEPVERKPDKVTYIPCPECGDLMLRQNFGKRSGVIIDLCKKHGVWFDADELRQVMSFVQAGGLDESRRRELEEMERKLSEKRNQVRSHRADAAGGYYTMPSDSEAQFNDLINTLVRWVFGR